MFDSVFSFSLSLIEGAYQNHGPGFFVLLFHMFFTMKEPKIVTVENLDFVSGPGYSWLRRHILNIRYSFLLRHADIVRVPSKAVADDVVKYYFVPKSKIRIV